jgi:uncharacterized membrane protein HdeD (DUF308 family)
VLLTHLGDAERYSEVALSSDREFKEFKMGGSTYYFTSGSWKLQQNYSVQEAQMTTHEQAQMMTHEQREDTTFPWWLVLLEGIFAAIFGFFLLIEPGGTLLFLVQVLGFYLFIGGILRIVSIFLDSSLWGLKLGIGILGILAGIVVLNHPLLSTIAIPTYIVYVVGFLAICEGVGGLIQAFRGSGLGAGLLGLLVIIFGIIVLLNPLIGVIALSFILGGFMLVGGIAAIVAAFRMRRSPATTGA